ncbi:MAG: 1-deoxy-D-xylulose-5-phosphate reductoisomerase [Rikenellaceae bacterium]|jgi:1-deoxy-D-xylulose-5-phosphate reductoisomerase|nr:1-deoxy-D-xylulose-5-phosphate reductoisomerase [Rikenellaceae bacterium]
MSKQRIAILGSTGSIGKQALEVIREHKDRFEVEVLTAGNNWQLLVNQAFEFSPDSVVIANESHYPKVQSALARLPIKVYAGSAALEQVVQGDNVDVVISALVGYCGLFPTIAAIKSRKKVALANKESLVVAGDLVMRLADEYQVPILPIDSEHSAIFQCLVGEQSEIEKIILTASGGPFLHTPLRKLKDVTVEDALRHPNWSMGAKITIDSATMINKGFEVIEAKWLFRIDPKRIEVVIHPQSVIHSMVQFADGAIKAQLGLPDMKIPIQYALTFPERLPLSGDRYHFAKEGGGGVFNFFEVEPARYRNLGLAYQALRRGGNAPCVLNAANEVAVHAFLERKIGFLDMTAVLERTMDRAQMVDSATLDDYKMSDTEARLIAAEEIKKIK